MNISQIPIEPFLSYMLNNLKNTYLTFLWYNLNNLKIHIEHFSSEGNSIRWTFLKKWIYALNNFRIRTEHLCNIQWTKLRNIVNICILIEKTKPKEKNQNQKRKTGQKPKTRRETGENQTRRNVNKTRRRKSEQNKRKKTKKTMGCPPRTWAGPWGRGGCALPWPPARTTPYRRSRAIGWAHRVVFCWGEAVACLP